MVIADSQGCAGGLAIEWRRQPNGSIHLGTIRVAMLGEQILTCKTKAIFSPESKRIYFSPSFTFQVGMQLMMIFIVD